MKLREDIKELLQIRYVKLHFVVQFLEDAVFTKDKANLLRGGMGEMLLRANCIRNRECTSCDFESECIVQRTMYSKYEQQPEFVTKGDSIGYVIECENYEKFLKEGSVLKFNLILFGKTIVYFNQYLQAFYALGLEGIGENKARYQILAVKNSKNEDILIGNQVLMSNYEVQMLSDYVEYRLAQLKEYGLEQKIRFKTPLALKYQGKLLEEFDIQAIATAIMRRIYMFLCYEGKRKEVSFFLDTLELPSIIEQYHTEINVPRVSTRHHQRMIFKGIKGTAFLEQLEEDFLALLLAGEIIHIGSNTSFGFGRYRVF